MSGKRILFVDDQRYMHELVRPALQELGRDYRFVTTMREALENLDGNIGVILCDIQLGDANGLDFVEEVRGKRNIADIPIIMLSQYTDRETIDRALACGADDYIVKPFKLKRIVDALTGWLSLGDTAFKCEGLSREQARLVRLTMATMGRSMAAARAGEEIPYQAIRDNCLAILQGGNDAAIVGILGQLKQKNLDIYLHSIKFAAHLGLMASSFLTDKEQVLDVITAGLLHDIGMAGLPDSYFEKEWLTDEERDFVRVKHVEFAKKILAEQPKPLPKIVGLIATFHHERLDGSGPFRIPGEKLSNVVRAACVTEEFLERRSGPWVEHEPTYRIIESMQGDGGFDMSLVDLLKRSAREG